LKRAPVTVSLTVCYSISPNKVSEVFDKYSHDGDLSSYVLELRRIMVEQTKAERWNGQLPSSIYAGAPIPFLNVK